MPKLDLENTCPTRSKGGYIPQRYKSSSFEKSFFNNTMKLCNSLPKDIQHKELLFIEKNKDRWKEEAKERRNYQKE